MIKSKLYKYPACFSPQIIEELLNILQKNSLILDLFVSGTTGLSSLLSNREVLNDLNEFAVFVSKIKTTKYTLTSINEFEKWFADVYQKRFNLKINHLKILIKILIARRMAFKKFYL